MPYDKQDPRAQLSTAGSAPTGIPRAAHYRELHATPADDQHAHGSRTWWTRSQAMVIGQTDAKPGDELPVDHVDGEHGVIAAATAPALAARCANASEYAQADDNVAEFRSWPEPAEGHAVRVYPVAKYPVVEGRLGRIFRCSTVMVNVFDETDQPRATSKLSPHHHDDFEQISLQVAGDYVHHMRVPWTPDGTTWRDDEHQACTGPAVVVIPPPLVHTSQAVNVVRHWLIDVFAPPRVDFSERPGWVLNADEYPMPAR